MAFNRDKALKEADKLVSKGKDREAIAIFQEIVKNDPRDLNSVNKIGDLFLKIGDRAGAVDAFAKVAEKYATDGFVLRAIAMYKKCTRAEPARMDFVERLAELNAQQGLTNEAKANFTQVAEHYLKEGKSQKARQLYARIAEIEPDNLKNRLKLADLYLRENQVQQALGEYQVIGAELAKKGMLDESLQVLDKALGLDPSNLQILRASARTRAEVGRAEEAIQFIRTKLAERGGRDPDLLLVLGETYQAAGNHEIARQALDRAAEVAPDRADIRHALSRLLLAGGDLDGALAQYVPVANQLVAQGKGAQAIEDLKAFLRVRDGHVGTLEKMLAIQVELGADARVQADCMSRLSEAYIAQGRYPEAERVLARLVVLDPEVAQHSEKLDFVRAKARGGAEAPPAAPTEAPGSMSDMSFGGLDESSAGFSMSFDDGELQAGGNDDRAELISERTAEADVFIKYGLVDKAIEQLQGIIAQYPDDIPTRQRLKQLYQDEGRAMDAAEQLVSVAALHRQAGDAAAEQQALQAAAQIAPSHPAVARLAAAAPAAVRPAAASSAPMAGGFELSLEDDSEAPAATVPAAASFAFSEVGTDQALSLDSGSSADSGGFDLSLDGDEAEAPPAVAARAAAPAPSGAGEFEIALDEDFGGDVVEEPSGEFDISLDADEPSVAAAPVKVAAPAADEFEISMDADEPGTGAADFEIAMDDAPAEAEGDGSFEIDMDEPAEDIAVSTVPEPVPAEAMSAGLTAPPVAADAEEGLFGEEDDFFNFADEINKEMESSEAMTEVAREGDTGMTLEQIISGIQKGVAAQVDKEDYETHYNLGIAYKEMGLQDEAIGEFQYASRDATRFLACCILLGACFTEKGMPELAIQWYDKAKTAINLTDEDRVALDYEIALCREAMGEDEAALKGFMNIYSMNARYRDVSQRVARLKQAIGR